MTREDAKELFPIIKAFAFGANIQYRMVGDNEWNDVNRDTNVAFNSSGEEYRIKQEPTLRPFISLEECWKEMHNHQEFGWLMKKDDGELTLIYGIYKDNNGNVMVKFGNDPNYNLNVVEVFYIYTFADGTPFGIMEG